MSGGGPRPRYGAMPESPAETAAFEAFVAPARARAAVWRLGLGVMIVAVLSIIAHAVLFLAEPELGGRGFLIGFLLASFGAILGLAAALRLLHRRRLVTLIGPGGLRPRSFGVAVSVVAAVASLTLLPDLILASPVTSQPLATWLPWVAPALAALFVQTATEELVFRGYLMQQLAARFRARLIWLGLPALLFGLLHWNPDEFGPHAWLIVAVAFVIGLVLGDVTAREGNLSAAMGLHFGNNVFTILVIGPPSPLGVLSLWTLAIAPDNVEAMRATLIVNIAATLVAWGLYRVISARRRRGRSLQSPERGSI